MEGRGRGEKGQGQGGAGPAGGQAGSGPRAKRRSDRPAGRAGRGKHSYRKAQTDDAISTEVSRFCWFFEIHVTPRTHA